VRFEVWDTGLGIPPERLTEIFEEFRQLETPGREREGMGLGLAIVERIARLLDVRLDVRSREGRGSMFAVDVPAGDPAARPAPPARVSMRERPNPLAGRTVLVIDDDRDTLDGMAMILDGWGCRTLMARSIETAVALTARRAARPDFIFADYHLGAGGTGLEAVERIRACYDASIGAAIVTADRSTETEARVTANGMPLLNKPVTVERLRSVIHKALG
jgi:CheY-like chemotaxis protein